MSSDEAAAQSVQTAARARWLDAYRALDSLLPRTTPTSTDAPHARELIDAELAAIRHLTSTLKERRNELALPSLLPPEILALIFSFLAHAVPAGPSGKYYQGRITTKWVTVSHVCRHWRNICLSQPSLWTHLGSDSNRQPWELFLERAKEAPLFVRGLLTPERHGETRLQSILDHRHQIQELSLLDVRLPLLQELVVGLNGSLRCLRVLCIGCSPYGQKSSSPSLPPRFLEDVAPNIEQLSLLGVIFPWGEGSRNLTSFDYQHGGRSLSSGSPLSHPYTYADVVRSLHQMPRLKSLNLGEALPDCDAGLHEEFIFLPQLEELVINNRHDSCWRLWSQLRIPSTTGPNIFDPSTTATDSLIASALQAHLQTSPKVQFSSMSVNIQNYDSDILHFTLSPPDEPGVKTIDGWVTDSYTGPRISLGIRGVSSVTVARQLIAAVTLEDIRSITLVGVCIDDIQLSYDLFRPARGVRSLELENAGSQHHLAALLSSPSLADGTTSVDGESPSLVDERMLFPDLRVLTCRGVNFDQSIQLNGSDVPLHKVLSDALESRSNDLGSTLETVKVVRCSVLEEWVDNWNAIVDDVKWDGNEGDLAPSEDEDEDPYGYGYGGPLGYDDDDYSNDDYGMFGMF